MRTPLGSIVFFVKMLYAIVFSPNPMTAKDIENAEKYFKFIFAQIMLV